MSGVIKKGVQQSTMLPEVDLAPNLPPTTRIRAVGSRPYCLAQAVNYRRAGWRASVRQEGDTPLWRMEASIEGDPADANSTLENTHELRANLLNPDLKSNLVLRSKFVGDAIPSIAGVQKLANQILTGEIDYAAALVTIEEALEDADVALGVELLDLLLSGADTFTSFQYVYIHTFNFGSAADLSADFTNVGKFFSTPQLRFAEGIPQIVDLPAGEWLKMAPEKTVAIGECITLKYEYWWAETWSTLLYDPAT